MRTVSTVLSSRGISSPGSPMNSTSKLIERAASSAILFISSEGSRPQSLVTLVAS